MFRIEYATYFFIRTGRIFVECQCDIRSKEYIAARVKRVRPCWMLAGRREEDEEESSGCAIT